MVTMEESSQSVTIVWKKRLRWLSRERPVVKETHQSKRFYRICLPGICGVACLTSRFFFKMFRKDDRFNPGFQKNVVIHRFFFTGPHGKGTHPGVAWEVDRKPIRKGRLVFRSYDFSFWQTSYASPGCIFCPSLKRCLVGYVSCSKFAGFQNPYQTPSKATIRATPMVRFSVFWRVHESWIKGFFF